MAVVVRGGTVATAGTDVSPLAFGTFPSYSVGDRLVVWVDVCGDFGSTGNWSSDPTGWSPLDNSTNGEHRTGIWSRVATSTGGGGDDAFSLPIANVTNTRGKIGHYWALSPCDIVAYDVITDTSSNTTYDVPALTGTAVDGQIGFSATVAGNRTLTALTGTDTSINTRFPDASNASNTRLMSGWDAFSGTNPSATTGTIGNGNSTSIGSRILFTDYFRPQPLQRLLQAAARASTWFERHDGIFVPERRLWVPNPS